ncbi:ribosomal protection-like ABC-F family protein [Anaeromassilibacillus senegalensis]|uniref:ABC-F family ATP-binding cassette domain-containing protein n=1 Tax=Anaeromassilibacillus senegalensis TaxID=1673717 RepID=A0ABS9CKG1_9FIRM|nr:ABC-F family ATP-binding cassette domain-containing protein [Anaeromassilibacillus senegalensis]MCF2651624.1 ABC-F family ATP-binding cassette domain-containing protein [Anaeromassilibacillus senegalensis]
MAILTVNNIKKMFGTDTIIQDITFEVQKGDRIGLVGINGSGKTTLFKVLNGEYSADEGSFTPARDTSIGYMEQHVCRDMEKPAFDEVMTVFAPLLKMEAEIERLTAEIAAVPENIDALIEKQTELNDRFIADGGLTCRNRARSTLIGLGFAPEQIYAPIGVLSGGQKAKIQLAKMLLGESNLLLLDEPTNHLDIPSVEWLEDFLKNYSGSYIVISHDRYFLDAVTNRTFEIENTRLTEYKGNYTRFLHQKEENRVAMQRVYDNTQREIKRIEGIIEQQKRFNQERNYVTIASKQKSIDRLEATLQKPEDEPDTIRFQFKASQRGGNDVLMAEDLALQFGENRLFQNVNLEIKRGEKVFLIGPNGCGKTSLLKILLDIYKETAGEHRFGANIDIGYYDQAQGNLDESKTVIDEIWDLHPYMTQTQVRSALAVFLFKGEDVYKPVKGLSGGERARVLLLKLMLSKANLLILDEPTNHLDIGSCEALENALLGYDGTLFVVSHDRYLINKLADKIYYLDPTGTTLYLGNYDAYLEARQQKEAAAEAAASLEATAKPNAYRQKKERASEIRKKKAALSKCERDIEATELEIEALNEKLLDPEIASDYEQTLDITNQIAACKEQSDALMNEWTALNIWLEENGEA